MAEPNKPFVAPEFPVPMGEDALNYPETMAENPSLLGATWRSTAIGSTIASEGLWERIIPRDTTPVDTEQLIEMLDRDKMWGYEDHFLSTRTLGQYNATKADIEREKADKEVFAEAGFMKSMAAGLVVGLADPINWIPIGRAVNTIRAGGGILRTAAANAVVFGGINALQEPILQGTQELRDWTDGVKSVAAGALLGGLIGGVGATVTAPGFTKVATRFKQDVQEWMFGAEWNQKIVEYHEAALAAINAEMKTNPLGPMRVVQGPTQTGAPIGTVKMPSVKQLERRDAAFDALEAAEGRLALYRDNSMYTTGPSEWARTIIPRAMGYFHQGFLDPSDFFLKRTASVEAKQAWQQMAEVAQFLNKNIKERSSTGEVQKTAQAATSEMDWYVGRWSTWRDAMWGTGAVDTAKGKAGMGNSLYAKARQNGFAGGSEDFDKAVHLAVVRGYTDTNPGVQEAAQLYKKLVAEPIRELMVKAGYPDPGMTPRFALGYARRNYVVSAVRGKDKLGREGMGNGEEFRRLAADAYFNELITEARAAAAAMGTPLTPQQIGAITKKSKNLARDTYNNITGVEGIGDGGLSFVDLQPGSPFKERVLPISDEELINRGYISSKITDSAHLHMRQTVPQMLYAMRFKTKGGSPDPGLEHSVIPKIKAEYKKMAETLGGADAESLIREGDRVIAVLRDQRDSFLKGPGFRNPNSAKLARTMETLVNNTMTWQAMRLMSNLVPASVPDIAGIAFQHGMGTQLKVLANDVAKFFKANPIGGLSRAELAEEMKTFGATVEWASNAGVAAHMDLNSPYQTLNGRFTNALHSMSRVFSWSNGSMWWNDMAKGKAFRASMDRILRTAEKGWDNLADFDQRFLANHGIGKEELNRVGAAWRSQNGPLHDGYLRFAWMSDWADQDAATILSNAIAKNRASTVIQPRVGDKNALAQSNPVWRAILQFQSFVFSHTLRVMTLAEQRLIADGFSGRDSLRVTAGLLQYAALGMMSQWLMAHAWDYSKGVADGATSRVKKLYENPGQWIAQGIERAGITGLFGQYNTLFERAGGKGMTRGWQNLMNDQVLTVDAKDSWRDRDVAQAFGGPTVSQAIDLSKVGIHAWNHAWSGEGLKRSDVKTLSEIGPWQNNIFMRKHVLDPAAKWLAEDQLGIAYDR